MDVFARGITKLYVTFTQYPFNFDDFLKSVDLTEDEYNAIMNYKEPEYDDRYSDEEWDEIRDKWYKIDEQQFELEENLKEFKCKSSLYDAICDEDYWFYEDEEIQKEFKELLDKYLKYAEVRIEDYQIDIMREQSTVEEKADGLFEYKILIEFEVDSGVELCYGYEGDPSIGQYRDFIEPEPLVDFNEDESIPDLTAFFRKICNNNSSIQVNKVVFVTRDTEWDFIEEEDSGYGEPDTPDWK